MKKEIQRLTPEHRKKLIYNATVELVNEFGGNVNRKMVAEKCNISPGLINKYFGSGYKLVTSVMAESGIECSSREIRPMDREYRKRQLLEWAIGIVKTEGAEAITNRRIFTDCEIGTYRAYLLYGGVIKLREAAIAAIEDSNE